MYGGVGHLVQVEAGPSALRESSPETVRGGYPFVRGVSGARQSSLEEALLRRGDTWKFRLWEQVRFFSIKERKQDEEGFGAGAASRGSMCYSDDGRVPHTSEGDFENYRSDPQVLRYISRSASTTFTGRFGTGPSLRRVWEKKRS